MLNIAKHRTKHSILHMLCIRVDIRGTLLADFCANFSCLWGFDRVCWFLVCHRSFRLLPPSSLRRFIFCNAHVYRGLFDDGCPHFAWFVSNCDVLFCRNVFSNLAWLNVGCKRVLVCGVYYKTAQRDAFWAITETSNSFLFLLSSLCRLSYDGRLRCMSILGCK